MDMAHRTWSNQKSTMSLLKFLPNTMKSVKKMKIGEMISNLWDIMRFGRLKSAVSKLYGEIQVFKDSFSYSSRNDEVNTEFKCHNWTIFFNITKNQELFTIYYGPGAIECTASCCSKSWSQNWTKCNIHKFVDLVRKR